MTEDIELTPMQSLVLWAAVAMTTSFFAGLTAALLYVGWVQYF